MSTPPVNTKTRTQTRHTSQPGVDPATQFWTIDSDTDPKGLPGPIPIPPAPPSGAIKVGIVTASGNDGNLPGNVIDGKTTSRWSCQGIGSWIQLDLGTDHQVDKISIDWFMQPAETRTNDITITLQDSVSGATGGTTVIPFSSIGSHSDIPIKNIKAKTIKFVLNKTSNAKGWFSMNEITVYGSGGVPGPVVPPGPTPTPGPNPVCPAGEYWDATLNKCMPIPPGGIPKPVPTPTPTPTGAKDEFGLQKMYGDHPTHKAYYALKPGDDGSRQYEEKAVAKSNGRWSFPNGTQGRIEFLPYPNAKDSDVSTYNLKTVLEKQNGILHTDPDLPNGDWPTIGGLEITWCWNMITPGSGSNNGAAHTEIVPGGFRQSNGSPQDCQAMSYHFNNYTDGRVKFEKDSEHTSGYTAHDPEKQGALGNVVGKDVCQKAVLYAVPNPAAGSPAGAGKTSKYFVKLEQFHDVGLTGTFTKTIEFLDDGSWGPTRGGNSSCCSGDKAYEYVVLWMSRMAIGIRCDNMNAFEFWNVSVRSIDSSKSLHASTVTKAPHQRMIEEDVVRTDNTVSKKELIQTKTDVGIIASQAEDPSVRKDASTVARKLDQQVSTLK